MLTNIFSPFVVAYQYNVYAEEVSQEETSQESSEETKEESSSDSEETSDEESQKSDKTEEASATDTEDEDVDENNNEGEEQATQPQASEETQDSEAQPTDPTEPQVPGDILPDGASSERPDPEPTPSTSTEPSEPQLTEESKEKEFVTLEEGQEIKDSTSDSWEIYEDEDFSITKDKVALGVKYIFPLEEKVSVTFTKLPAEADDRSHLKIQKIKSEDLKLPEDLMMLAEYAYDITTGMEDGDFEYELELPKPENIEAEVSYIEKDVSEALAQDIKTEDVKSVDKEKLDQKSEEDMLKVTDLDHLTIFFVSGAKDNTPLIISHTLNVGELNKLKFSDDSRYETEGAWPILGALSEYIEFVFNPEIPNDKVIESVKINFEYQRSGVIFPQHLKAELKGWDGSGYNALLATYANLGLPDKDKDYSFVIDVPLSLVDTPAKVNAFKIKFYMAGKDFVPFQTKFDVVNLDIVTRDATSSVTVCKVEDNQNKTPLPDWMVMLKGEKVETVNVSPDGNDYNSSSLLAGNYVLEANGTYVYRPNDPAASISDAGYSLRLPGDAVYGGPNVPWVAVKSFPSPYTGFLGVMLNGDDNTDWGYFSPSHQYAMGLNHAGGSLAFSISDDVYSDNSGSILVDIYKGYAGLTSRDGCITFDGVPYGIYTLDEILKNHWVNVSGKDSEVVVDSATERFELVNKELPSEIDLSGQKFNDKDGDGTKDGNEPGLEGWVIKAVDPDVVETVMVDSTSVTGTNVSLPAGDYLFAVTGDWRGNSENNNRVDAEYITGDTWATFSDGPAGYGEDQGDLQINNNFVDWGPYSSSHDYYINYHQDNSGDVNLSVFDGNAGTNSKEPSWYSDNSGSLTVKIYKVIDEDTTDSNGDYALQIPVEFESVLVFEIPQRGWEQTYPENTYHDIQIPGSGDITGVDFGNRRNVPLTIVASKIVCSLESDLPNWGSAGGPDITSATAVNWVNTHESCELEEGWNFQWGYQSAPNPGDNLTGTGNAGWFTFGPTNASGTATVNINDLQDSSYLWMREVMKDGYVPFAYSATQNNNDYSAELYCHTDVVNYDNWDRVDGVELGNTYYCVAFNSPNKASIEVLKFNDKNGDKDQDSGENVLGNWTFYLYQGNKCEGSVLDTQVTSVDNGKALFNNLLPGTYSVKEKLETGWENTTDLCKTVTVSSQQTGSLIFGNRELGSIHGTKWEDLDGDAIFDEGEPKVSGWTIFIDKDGDGKKDAGEVSAITDANGSYAFTNLKSGNYKVCEVGQAGWQINYPKHGNCQTVNVTAGPQDPTHPSQTVNFGNQKKGSLTVCKIILDPSGNVVDGSSIPGNIFSLKGLNVSTSEGAPAGVLEETLFTTPLNYNADLLKYKHNNDAYCVTYNNLALGNYYYDKETLPGDSWEEPKYFDQYDSRLSSLSSFEHYSGELFDKNKYNDGYREKESDGHVLITEKDPSRTIIVLNQYKPIKVLGYKVVCDKESDLPNWGNGSSGPSSISATTAQWFVNNSEGNCKLVRDWDFQWGYGDVGDIQGVDLLPGDALGIANGQSSSGICPTPWCGPNTYTGNAFNKWKTFDSSVSEPGAASKALISDKHGSNSILVREVLKPNYLPFAYPKDGGLGGDAEDNFGAEIYCSDDVYNYDNLEVISNPEYGKTYYCVAFNVLKRGSITVIKDVAGENESSEEGGPSFSFNLTGESADSVSLKDGESHIFDNLPTGWYKLSEDILDDWEIPTIQCSDGSSHQPPALSRTDFGYKPEDNDDGDVRLKLDPGENITCTFTNRYEEPGLTLGKFNDVSGPKKPGDLIKFTLKVLVTGNNIYGLKVLDLPANGFKYVEGSWFVKKNGLAYSITEPHYASPGTWDLGDVQEGDEIELTYQAEIQNGVDPGDYKDIAWSQGNNALGNTLLALANTEGYIDDNNFVGTAVEVVKDNPSPEVKVEVEVEKEVKEVLGASSERLPATGSANVLLFGLLSTLMLGLASVFVGLRSKRRLPLPVVSLVAFMVAGIMLAPRADAALIVRLEEPKPDVKGPFNITFVTMDTDGNDIIAKCFKKGPSDGGFSQFMGDIPVTAGGNSYNCEVDNSILDDEGTYEFYVLVKTEESSVDSSKVSTEYDASKPGKPKYIEKDKKNSCKYEVEFKTADDGQTSYVEVYRSSNKEFKVDEDTRIATVSIGPNTKHTFEDTLPSGECDRPYYAARAFDSAGNYSGVRLEELSEEETVTIAGESEESESEALLASASVLGEATGTGGPVEVTLPSDSEDGSVLGEKDNGAATAQVQNLNDNLVRMDGFSGRLAKPWVWIIALIIGAGVIVGVLRKRR